MRHLFSRTSDGVLAGLMQQQPLLGFDFDGTLAALVERPSMARLGRGHRPPSWRDWPRPCPSS